MQNVCAAFVFGGMIVLAVWLHHLLNQPPWIMYDATLPDEKYEAALVFPTHAACLEEVAAVKAVGQREREKMETGEVGSISLFKLAVTRFICLPAGAVP